MTQMPSIPAHSPYLRWTATLWPLPNNAHLLGAQRYGRALGWPSHPRYLPTVLPGPRGHTQPTEAEMEGYC